MGDNPHDLESRSYASGIESPVERPPQRVVSLVPALTESLFDLDLGSRLVAITDDCIYPANRVQSLPRVGRASAPDLDRIIELQPDLVLLHEDMNRRADADTLRAASVPIWIVGPRSVFETLNLLWAIMNIFDHPLMIPRVREIERAYDYTAAVSRTQIPVRVFVPFARDPWVTFNADTYANDVLRVCGAENIFAAQTNRRPLITLEQVVDAQPEVVLLPAETFFEGEAASLHALDIPAAHQEHIYLIDGTLLTWAGTRVAYALRDLPALFLKESE